MFTACCSYPLQVVQELDREKMSRLVLIVKASEDCAHTPENVNTFTASDDTLLRVVVNVKDINDNAPHFTKRVFTGGVTTEADFGTEFMQVKVWNMIVDYLFVVCILFMKWFKNTTQFKIDIA